MTENGKLLVPALRAKMGDNVYYISFLTMREIAKRVSFAEELHQNKGLRELIQRRVTNRSKEISSYLRTQPQRFFNALIIGVYGGAPQWYELSIEKTDLFDPNDLPTYHEGVLGILKLEGAEKLFAMDGQHRVAGIKEAVKTNEVEGLADEEVCTIFLSADVTKAPGLERTRRLFSTLNRYAKPVDMMDLIALDEDDAIAIVTRKLIEEYPLFKGHRISVLKGKGVPVTDNKCFTNITTLYEVNDIILADERGRKWRDFKRFRPSDAKLSGLYEKATNFWDLMVLHFPSIADVQNSEEEIAGRYRDKNGGRLLFRTIGLLSMAKAIKTAVDSGDNLESWMQKFSNVPTDLASSPWIGLFWDSSEKVMIIRKENQTIGILLLLYMVGLDLTKINTSETRLKARYASALNRQEDEIQLPEKII